MSLIIGNGLIAKSFHEKIDNNCIIFASGVSNSQEARSSEFSRELDLLKSTIRANSESIIVYFSTCSVYQKSKSPYIIHKLMMEKYIQENISNYYIFRLPQVVGSVKNSTIVSFFTNQIINNEKTKIQKCAFRNLVDIDDIVRIVQYILSSKLGKNSIQNIASNKNISAFNIYSKIAEILALPANIEMIDGGQSYEIPINDLSSIIGEEDIIFKPNYWEETLIKYTPILYKLHAI